MKKITFFFLCLFLSIGFTVAQTVKVGGTVISDEDGLPVIGASVTVRGHATVGTITDADGKYSLEVPSSAKTLVISYVGMNTESIPVTPDKHVTTVMRSDIALDEVVVTALGLSREKKSLGYAVQEVKSDELTKAGNSSLTGSLSGKFAGVQVNQFGGTVGASSRIAVRGNSSLANDQQPLIVVDGVPIANDTQRSGDNYYNGVDYGSGLNDINPEDIESISVLKGGSAALYGMRAGNGVILITTKSGKSGNKGVSISYDLNITMDRAANLPKLQNLYGQGHDGDEYHWQTNHPEMSYQDYSTTYGFDWNTDVNTGYDESWGPRLDAGLKISQFDSNGEYTDWKSQPNNAKDFFETGLSMNHVVSVLANGDKSTTRASLSFRDSKGTVPNTDQKRYSGSINSNMQLNDFVSFTMSAEYTRTKSDNLVGQGYGSNNPMGSLFTWSGRQVNMNSLKNNWDQKNANGDYTFYNWINFYNVNPYFNVYKNTNSMQRDRFFGKSSLFYTPFDWLKLEGRIGMDYYNMQTFERYYNSGRGDYPDGRLLQVTTKNTELNADFIASVNKTWGDFNLTGLLGANYRDLSWETHSMGATALVVPGVYTMANKSGDAVATMDHSHIRSNSVYAQASLGWRNQLYLDASARNDWSSTIKDDFFYPSVSLSWIATESFPSLKNDVLSFLKLRGSIAEIGSATTAYRNSYYYYAEGTAFNGVPQMYKSFTYPNYDLKPENISTWEIGTELGFLHDRLHLDVTYYQKKTSDMILSVSTSNVVGFGSMLVNAGRIDNKGIEVQLSGDILQSKEGLNWTSTVNFSKDKSKVIELYKDPDTGKELLDGGYGMGWTWGIDTKAIPGEEWGILVGTGYTRVTKEDVEAGKATSDQIGAIKLNANGAPISSASAKMGRITPDYMMSWSNEFNIQHISFGFMLDYRKGGDIWSQSLSHSYATGTARITAEDGIRERAVVAGVDVDKDKQFVMEDANGNWVKNTIETSAYDWYNGMGVSETYVFDGSFLKLREAHISYQFPKSIMEKTKYFKNATVSLIGTNLWLIWVDKSNTLRLDPETGGVSSDSRGIGFEQSSVPNSRSFGLKLGLTF